MEDGIELRCISHPRPIWIVRVFNRVKWWIRPPDVNKDSLEEIWVDINNDGKGL